MESKVEKFLREVSSGKWLIKSPIRIPNHHGLCLRFKKGEETSVVVSNISSTSEKDTTYYIDCYYENRVFISRSQYEEFAFIVRVKGGYRW